MTTRPLYVGIDLGTTNSTVAVFDGEEVTLIRNNQGSVLTPSVVRIDARGNVIVGTRARRFLDRKNNVHLDVLVTGFFPGAGKPGPIAYPDPSQVSEVIQKIRVVDLVTLVQLKR